MTRRRRKRKKRLKWVNIILFLFIITCTITLLISIINIIIWKLDSNKTNEQINIIQNITQIEYIEDDKEIEIIEQKEIDKSSPYWDYIKMNLINVDFNELKKLNSETVGWIQVNGTNINYPFVQANDNKYYLNHSFDKSSNEAGWVFLDYRNDYIGIDKNSILYAHGRNDNTMFGSLINILTNGWLNNKNNFILKVSTEKENSLWQVFSAYVIPTTSDYLKINFNNNEQFLEFSNMLIERSEYNFNTTVNKFDKILTLSTCYNNTHKTVLHAKLIKKSSN